MRNYELLVLVAPDLDQERIDVIHQRIRSVIEGSGGAVTNVEVWGKRRLAYEIKGYRDGHYTLFNFQMPAHERDELDHTLRVTDGVMRYLITRVEEPKVAKSEPEAEQEPEAGAAAAQEAPEGAGEAGEEAAEEAGAQEPAAAEAAETAEAAEIEENEEQQQPEAQSQPDPEGDEPNKE